MKKKILLASDAITEAQATERAKRIRQENQQRAKEKATDGQWQMVEWAVKAFMDKYPLHMQAFLKDLDQGRSKYNVAKEGGLKKSNFRNTASFPVIYDQYGNEVDALLPVLKKIIPGLTDRHSKNYSEFIRRFPIFCPADKENASEF